MPHGGIDAGSRGVEVSVGIPRYPCHRIATGRYLIDVLFWSPEAWEGNRVSCGLCPGPNHRARDLDGPRCLGVRCLVAQSAHARPSPRHAAASDIQHVRAHVRALGLA